MKKRVIFQIVTTILAVVLIFQSSQSITYAQANNAKDYQGIMDKMLNIIAKLNAENKANDTDETLSPGILNITTESSAFHSSLTVDNMYTLLKSCNMPIDYTFYNTCKAIESYKSNNHDMQLAQVFSYFDSINAFTVTNNQHSDRSLNNTYNAFMELSDEEQALVILYPAQALAVNSCKNKAFELESAEYGTWGSDTQSDGFRHAIWNALMSDIINSAYAELFATAHESTDTSYLAELEYGYYRWQKKDMDLHNNAVGRSVISTTEQIDPSALPDSEIVERIKERLTNNIYGIYWLNTETQPTFTADVDGDGCDDLILARTINGKRAFSTYLSYSNGSFADHITTTSTRTYIAGDPTFVGDVNGDGRADMIVHWSNGGKRQLLVYLGNSDGSFSSPTNFSSTRNHDPVALPTQFFVGDVNGDGKDDFIVHWKNGDGKRCTLVYKGKATSPYFEDAPTNAITSTNDYRANDPVFIGDVNGDGRDDMIVHWSSNGERRLLVYKANSDGTYANGISFSSNRNHNPSKWPCQFFVDDVNNDGKDDFIVHWKNNNGKRCILVYKGQSTSPYFSEAVDSLTSTNNYVISDPVFCGDVNGDGRADLVVHWAGNNQRRLLVYTANADLTYNAGTTLYSTRVHNQESYPCELFIAKVSNDNRSDIVVKWRDEGNVALLTYRGTSTGTFLEGNDSYLYDEIAYYQSNT